MNGPARKSRVVSFWRPEAHLQHGQPGETCTLKLGGDVLRIAGFNIDGPPVLALLAPAPAETVSATQETPAPAQPSN